MQFESNFAKGFDNITAIIALKSNMTWVINMQKSVFLPFWHNHELYGCNILHNESFSAKESENLGRNAKFFV